MTVNQIYGLVNTITSEVLGKSGVVLEDLSNIVDVGKELFDNTSVDNYVKTLVDKVAKMVFVTRPYSGSIPSIMMDSWEFGAVVQKVSAELPEAVENKSWELTNGTDYSPNVFYKPTVSNKFFNNKSTFEIDMSFTEMQVKGSFANANELNSFITMLYNAVENSFTVKIDGLVMRTINNMIAETINGDKTSNIKAVNVLKLYNTETGKTVKAKDCLKDIDFLRYFSMKMGLYRDRLSKMSTLFNLGAKDRFTPADRLHCVMLTDAKKSLDVYLQADIRHNENTMYPPCETVPYWQGSGTDYGFNAISSINVKIPGGATVSKGGILAIMFDSEAVGISNLNRRVTTNYNPKGEFYNNFFKMEVGAFNDLNENFVVFFVEDDKASV